MRVRILPSWRFQCALIDTFPEGRHVTPIRLACEVVRERDFKLIGREIVELSESGMLIRPETRVLTGDSLIVSFMAPFTRHFVDASGSVSRIIHGRRLGDEGPAIGIQFDEIDELGRALLKMQLACMPTSVTRRRALA